MPLLHSSLSLKPAGKDLSAEDWLSGNMSASPIFDLVFRSVKQESLSDPFSIAQISLFLLVLTFPAGFASKLKMGAFSVFGTVANGIGSLLCSEDRLKGKFFGSRYSSMLPTWCGENVLCLNLSNSGIRISDWL